MQCLQCKFDSESCFVLHNNNKVTLIIMTKSLISKEAVDSFLKHRHRYEEGREVTEEEHVCFETFLTSRLDYEVETSHVHKSGNFNVVRDKYQFIKQIEFLTEDYNNISIRRVKQKEFADVLVIVRVIDDKEQFLKFGSNSGIKPCWDDEMLKYGTNYHPEFWMDPSENFKAEEATFFKDQEDAVSFMEFMTSKSTVWKDIIIEMKQLYCTIAQH